MNVLFKNGGFDQLIDVSAPTDQLVAENGPLWNDEKNQLDGRNIFFNLRLVQEAVLSLRKRLKYGFILFVVLQVIFIVALTGVLVKYDKEGDKDSKGTSDCESKAPLKKEKIPGIFSNETGPPKAELSSMASTLPTVTTSLLPEGDISYVGCYMDASDRAMGDTFTDYTKHNDMTPVKCAHECLSRATEYKYFGLQVGKECFCGDQYDKYGPAPEFDCNSNCEGDSTIKCGGHWRLSVYKFGDDMPSVAPDISYVGCYRDKQDRAMADTFTPHERMTPEKCAHLCLSKEQAYKYFGLQAGWECFCGNQYAKYGQVPESDCYSSCKGNSSIKCGGAWRLSVYKFGGDVVSKLTTVGQISSSIFHTEMWVMPTTPRDMHTQMSVFLTTPMEATTSKSTTEATTSKPTTEATTTKSTTGATTLKPTTVRQAYSSPATEKVCNDGYTLFPAKGFCYKYFGDVRRTWRGARSLCRRDNMDLLMVKDEETHKYFSVVIQEEIGRPAWFWIGATDRNVEGLWEWVDGTPVALDRFWNSGEPNNDASGEDCAYMTHKLHSEYYVFNDNPCTITKHVICTSQ